MQVTWLGVLTWDASDVSSLVRRTSGAGIQSEVNATVSSDSPPRNDLSGVGMYLLQRPFQHLSYSFSGVLPLVLAELSWAVCNIPRCLVAHGRTISQARINNLDVGLPSRWSPNHLVLFDRVTM